MSVRRPRSLVVRCNKLPTGSLLESGLSPVVGGAGTFAAFHGVIVVPVGSAADDLAVVRVGSGLAAGAVCHGLTPAIAQGKPGCGVRMKRVRGVRKSWVLRVLGDSDGAALATGVVRAPGHDRRVPGAREPRPKRWHRLHSMTTEVGSRSTALEQFQPTWSWYRNRSGHARCRPSKVLACVHWCIFVFCGVVFACRST